MQRKLTVILSADVVGYSALMETDETGTLQRLKVNRREVFDREVAAHGGRQFKLMGDGALVEFASVVSAVECALAIQNGTNSAELDLPEDQRIRYRIGINLGEVIVDDDDFYGEGVNLAARLQALAPVGGVAVSRVVRDQAEGKSTGVFEDTGEHSVKNIQQMVHVYTVRSLEPGEIRTIPKPRQRKTSVCVLPFENRSDDPRQTYFSDGTTEDIITDLSKVSSLFVIARHTSFQFKGQSIDIAQIARQLNVSHIVEGSIRKAGNRVRVSAQLIDGKSGGHLWAERYDRELDDIFAVQDEIVESIVRALKLQLLPEEKKAIEHNGTQSVEAYNFYLMARQAYSSGNQGDPQRDESIVRLCRRAIDIDPNYALAWALLAYGQMMLRFSHGSPGDDGLAAVEKALSLDANLAEAHAAKARILFNLGRRDDADTEIKEALRLNPESFEVNNWAGLLAFRQNRLDEAARHYEVVVAMMEMELGAAAMLISCYTGLGNSMAARRAAHVTLSRVEKALARDPNNGAALGYGVSALACLGDAARARDWIKRALLIDPNNNIMRYNFACALAGTLKEVDAAIEVIGPYFAAAQFSALDHAKVDPDLELIRNDPRFQAMISAAETRLKAPRPAGNTTNGLLPL